MKHRSNTDRTSRPLWSVFGPCESLAPLLTCRLSPRACGAVAVVRDRPAVVVLSNSQRIGEELRWSTDRKFLSRALRLGFREVFLHGPESPPVCRDEHRTYVWALLSTEGALVPGDNMVSLTSPLTTVATSTRRERISAPRRHHRDTERTTPHMPRNRIAATLAGTTPEPANGSAPPAE